MPSDSTALQSGASTPPLRYLLFLRNHPGETGERSPLSPRRATILGGVFFDGDNIFMEHSMNISHGEESS